ncbi:MAG: tyrosine--tRNA ligase, partial [Nanoarchaeota archaeon]
ELKKKINNAYCPEKVEEGNPLLEYSKHIIFRNIKEMKIERPSKFGGNISFVNYEELRKAYVSGSLHPMDLKSAVTNELENLIKPVREYFEKNKKAQELYSVVKDLKITR